MENEPVFAGTAIIDAAANLRSRPSQRDHDLPLAASGGVKASHIGVSEDTSLLSGEEGSTYDGQGNNGVERRGEFKWQGENDFEGISWWNKPSVGPLISIHVRKLLAQFMVRFSGYYLPSFSPPLRSEAP